MTAKAWLVRILVWVARVYPVVLLVFVLGLTWHLQIITDSALNNYAYFRELMTNSTSWEELQFYTQFAVMYSAQADSYIILTYTVTFAGFGVAIAIANGNRSSDRLESIDAKMSEILELWESLAEADESVVQEPGAASESDKSPDDQ